MDKQKNMEKVELHKNWRTYDCKTLMRAIDSGELPINHRWRMEGFWGPGFDDTILMWHCLEGNDEIVEELLKRDADLYARTYKAGETCLHGAVVLNRSSIAEILLKRGMDVNVRSNHGHTALDRALMEENLRMIDLLRSYGGIAYGGANPCSNCSTIDFAVTHDSDDSDEDDDTEIPIADTQEYRFYVHKHPKSSWENYDLDRLRDAIDYGEMNVNQVEVSADGTTTPTPLEWFTSLGKQEFVDMLMERERVSDFFFANIG